MKIEQSGYAFAEAATYGSFIMIHVPVELVGEAPKGGAMVRYTIGSFVGLETKLLARADTQADLVFRIPRELFLARQRLKLEVVARDEGVERVLWTKRYEAAWSGDTPEVKPLVDLLEAEPEIVPWPEAEQGPEAGR